MVFSKVLQVAFVGVSIVAGSAAAASADACHSFTLENATNVAVSGSTYYAAGDLVNITNLFSSIDTDQLPSFCRVELLVTTNSTANSTAHTEVWLPDEWNNRFLALGNGGWGGGVNVGDLGFAAVLQGFAGMSTDTGHTSTQLNGAWGLHNENAMLDWGWRAVHLSVEAGKEVVAQYYQQAASKSYWLGCSTGGRQGLMSAQRFPEDFDGVVVGSPANWISHLQGWSIHIDLDVLPVNSSQWITPEMWTGIIHDEVLRQCDAIDGVTDGIINDPQMCSFRPETLARRPGQNASTCLNLDQIAALHKIYAPYYETNQTYISAGYYPGGEVGFAQGLVGEKPNEIGTDYFRYWVLNDTTWDYTTLNFSTIQLADEIDPGQQNAISPNLTGFAGPSHNGKLLHYVGWADQLISPGNSLYYYSTVQAFMQGERNDLNIDDYYRLFTAPGMQHCQLGYGANSFGGAFQASSGTPPVSEDPSQNVLFAMVAWVENGTAPDTLTATYNNNNNVSEGTGFTRPLCKYPGRLNYVGGNTNESSSFECV